MEVLKQRLGDIELLKQRLDNMDKKSLNSIKNAQVPSSFRHSNFNNQSTIQVEEKPSPKNDSILFSPTYTNIGYKNKKI